MEAASQPQPPVMPYAQRPPFYRPHGRGEPSMLAHGTQRMQSGFVPAERVPLHNHLCTKAFGFADAQVDLALAEIEKGFSLAQQREAAYSKCRVGSRLH